MAFTVRSQRGHALWTRSSSIVRPQPHPRRSPAGTRTQPKNSPPEPKTLIGGAPALIFLRKRQDPGTHSTFKRYSLRSAQKEADSSRHRLAADIRTSGGRGQYKMTEQADPMAPNVPSEPHDESRRPSISQFVQSLRSRWLALAPPRAALMPCGAFLQRRETRAASPTSSSSTSLPTTAA